MSIEEIIKRLGHIADCLCAWKTEAWEMIIRQAIALLRTHPDAQPNEPLTLEELRGMEGQPVWISPVTKGGKIPRRWMLVFECNPVSETYSFEPASGICQAYRAGTYGKTWLAYRRPPKEAGE